MSSSEFIKQFNIWCIQEQLNDTRDADLDKQLTTLRHQYFQEINKVQRTKKVSIPKHKYKCTIF